MASNKFAFIDQNETKIKRNTEAEDNIVFDNISVHSDFK